MEHAGPQSKRVLRHVLRALAGGLALCAAAEAGAFGIAPIPEAQAMSGDSLIRRVQRAVAKGEATAANWLRQRFRVSVHEEITHAAYGCTLSPTECDRSVAAGAREGAPLTVIQGVEWNDNPPFKLQSGWPMLGPACFRTLIQLPNSFPECWGAIFGAGAQWSALMPATQVAYGPGSLILLRSHFGDLQFLHAMASRDGETAQETRDRIIGWAGFVYQVADGHIPPQTILSSAKAGAAANFFPGSGMDVRTLFTLGSKPHSSRRVRDMAFGSLLHVVEDSFSAAHAEREPPTESAGMWVPGCIQEFHSYAHQDHSEHALADTHDALTAGHTDDAVVQVVRRLKEMRGRQDWRAVRTFLQDEVFAICSGYELQAAGPGDAYKLPPPNPETPE